MSRPPLIRQGDGPAAAILQERDQRERDQRHVDRIVEQAEQNPDLDALRLSRATAGGDERKLRGIPAIGRGVAGAIPGTSPHAVR